MKQSQKITGICIGGAVAVLSVSPGWAEIAPTTAASPNSSAFKADSTTELAQTSPTQTTPSPAPGNQPPRNQPVALPNPNVLVPNPQIRIEPIAAPAAGVLQPVAPAPPLLPRAIAPPVGDISVSNLNVPSDNIDLSTTLRIPRLVLKDSPAREVLQLLARSAGLNIVFIGSPATTPGAAPAPGAATTPTGPLISLDIDNEPVQNVFNYVLQISGLQANRIGRTIFIASQLPQGVRTIAVRSLRLNQIAVGQAVGYLISQGAEEQQVTTSTTITAVTDPETSISASGGGSTTTSIPLPPVNKVINTNNSVTRIGPQPDVSAAVPGQLPGVPAPLLLRGLAVVPDERLNTITLIGEPRKIELATALLTQLDLRRRQVAVNVKVVDVNLSGTDAANASFSFGVGKSFFSVDNGAATYNFGGVRPPTNGQVQASTIFPTITAAPFPSGSTGQPFLDVQGNAPFGTTTGSNGLTTGDPSQLYARPSFGTNSNPFQPGVTSYTPPTITSTSVTPAKVTYSLPSYFQYPSRFLAFLNTQITNSNAKVLTDPTLVIQEGEKAIINLTQEVFAGFTTTYTQIGTTVQPIQTPIIKNAGVVLEVQVSRIDDNGFITLAVNPTVSSIGGSQATTQGTITLLQVRQAQSGQIRLRDGQTLIISGIIQQSDTTTVTKVPVLGDIPLLGALFRTTSRGNQRNEVIVLLTPNVLDDSSRASFGYNYSPGSDARQMLQR